MAFRRSNKSYLDQEKYLTQPRVTRRNTNATSLSQPIPSTSFNDVSTYSSQRNFSTGELYSQSSQESTLHHMVSEEEAQLANSVIRYLLVLDRKKQIINKARIMKNVFGGQGKHFRHVMNKVKDLLSKVFGYSLIELEGNKYMLVNQLENSLPHINFVGTEATRQVLLFLVLSHIFMSEESCTEDSLFQFLRNLGILCEDNQNHSYFGNVKHIVKEVFVDNKYLQKIETEQNNIVKVKYKWGPRAEYEFSPRATLEFISQVYNGRPLNNWPLQLKTLIAREKRRD